MSRTQSSSALGAALSSSVGVGAGRRPNEDRLTHGMGKRDAAMDTNSSRRRKRASFPSMKTSAVCARDFSDNWASGVR